MVTFSVKNMQVGQPKRIINGKKLCLFVGAITQKLVVDPINEEAMVTIAEQNI